VGMLSRSQEAKQDEEWQEWSKILLHGISQSLTG
jgi:hypothetical protein